MPHMIPRAGGSQASTARSPTRASAAGASLVAAILHARYLPRAMTASRPAPARPLHPRRADGGWSARCPGRVGPPCDPRDPSQRPAAAHGEARALRTTAGRRTAHHAAMANADAPPPEAPEVLTTRRMRGERLGPRHLSVLAPILADPRVGATLGGVQAREQVAVMLEQAAERWRSEGIGYWMFFDTVTGAPVARGGLSRTTFAGRPEVEVGWTVAPEHWGEGFATELGAAALDVAFGVLGLDDVVAYTLPHNAA